MVNILHFTSESGEAIHINSEELKTKAGQEYLLSRLINKKVIASSDTRRTENTVADNKQLP